MSKQRFIYEIELKDKGVNVQNNDFILPKYRGKRWGGFFFNKEQYQLIKSTFPESVQKIHISESGGIDSQTWREEKYKGKFLQTHAEKDIEKYTLRLKIC